MAQPAADNFNKGGRKVKHDATIKTVTEVGLAVDEKLRILKHVIDVFFPTVLAYIYASKWANGLAFACFLLLFFPFRPALWTVPSARASQKRGAALSTSPCPDNAPALNFCGA